MAIPGNFLSQVTESVDPNTSGWVGVLNAVPALGQGGRNGDGCLIVRSVAAGETRARTVSQYPVQAGTVYQAFADASSPTVSERIGIRWLTHAGIEISTTWSLTTATVSSTWHRIGVAGVAPTDALFAQVVLSGMTPAAANVINYFENVYLGLPIRTTGNLLDFNAETHEVDASGWMVETNCSLARAVRANSWPVDYYHGGGHMLTVTATASGNASIKTAAPVPATAGVEFVAFGHISPPAAGNTCWIELRFLDGSGTLLQAVRSVLDAPDVGTYRQIASAVAPAGTVSAVLATGMTGATAGQVMFTDNHVIADLSQTRNSDTIQAMPAGSILPYADASFEQGVGTWTRISGVGTLARSTPWGAHTDTNAYSLQVSSSTATKTIIATAPYPLPADARSQPWGSRIGLRTGAGSWTVSAGCIWYDADGEVILSELSPPEMLPTTGLWYLLADGTFPEGSVAAAMQVGITANAANAVLYLDTAAVLPMLPINELAVSEDTASLTLTLRSVTVGSLFSLWRVTEDGARTLVRGPSGLYSSTPMTSDVLVVEDYEAPLGVPVYYYSEERNASTGALIRSTTWETGTIPAPDRNYCWLKDPGNPQRNIKVMVSAPGPDWQRPIDQTAYVVKGRRNKVILGGIRQGLEGDLLVFTQSDDERVALHWLLDSGNTLLWQAVAGMGVSDMYVTVGQITEARGGDPAQDPWRTFTLPLIEADMPVTTGVNGSAGRTWQDILTEYDTWQDVVTAFATWENVLLNRKR